MKEYQKKGERILPRAPHETIAWEFLEQEQRSPEGSYEDNPRSQMEPSNKKEAVEVTEKAKAFVKHFQEQEEALYSFDKVEEFPVPTQQSQTALSLELRKKEVAKPVEITIPINVYMPNHKPPILVKVKPTTTIEEVIGDVLSKIGSIDSLRSMNLNVRGYLLRIAEKDGTPDEDIPALVRNKNIGQFLKISQHYALCKDPSFFKEVWPINEDPSEVVLKVMVPGDTSYSTFLFKDEYALKEIREQACSKRGLKADDYHVVLSSQPDKPLSLDQKVGALLEKTLKLIDGDSCDDPLSESLHDPVRSISKRKDSNASLFVKKINRVRRPSSGNYAVNPSYTVVRVGKKRTSLITLDGINDQLIFRSAEHKKEKTKHLRELAAVSLVPGKQMQFQMDFKQKIYRFETQQADEIVAKIDVLWQRYLKDN
ncbi:hypothetical protein PROFUN_04738 [Planoprotostelium fungivorum]|uniref:CRIM domain-containing protein n=1 Tax=Planoprotostelium fungivorum TaxID=1890364 RepID=A0A2P6NG15_9EUKA|nr:hypothetical protein PROFUN_04738 [Planoprotostelium fungivorum]